MGKGTVYQNFERALLEHEEIKTTPSNEDVYISNLKNLVINEEEAVKDYDNMLSLLNRFNTDIPKEEVIKIITEIRKDELDHIKILKALVEGDFEKAKSYE